MDTFTSVFFLKKSSKNVGKNMKEYFACFWLDSFWSVAQI